jgi:uncharacterized circularly permuted ATP-grasp superfamily protein/uncharacterized alpha-E superfamily protein
MMVANGYVTVHSAETQLRHPPPKAGAAWDELRAASGEMRPQWQPLIASLGVLGREELAIRVQNGRRILREHGVSCLSSDPDGEREVQWELDCIPLVVGAAEWRELEAGLVQRARLLNLILGDLYGIQRLVRDGFLPAPLIYANPGYLRACQNVRVPGGTYLHLYAADLARGPEGRWRVLADRTQAPAGFGFVLENRRVLSHVLPEVLHAMRPRSLSETLRVRREALRRLAPSETDNPTIVLLTPGPRNESYFEHAYLARMLGFALVEGGDLTVRDHRVFLKTLDGLRPVDLVVRCVTDAFCDPLALRGESALGVAGLVEATRAGRVSVANALGSGLVESPAFFPFLPGLAAHLLGQELRLPSVATWWCGQPLERKHVEEHLDELLLRPAFSTAGPLAVPGGLTNESRAEWVSRLRECSHEFVGQEQIRLSRAPAWPRDSRPITVRVFVVFDGQDFFAVPGGLARLVEQDALATATLSLTGGCKDVWVLSDDAESPASPALVAAPAPALERLASDLPSRTAENFFWLGRYAERLEQLLRLCRSALGHLADESANGPSAALADLLGRLGLAASPQTGCASPERLQKDLLAVLYDSTRNPSVRGLLKRIQTSSFSVRDRLSGDTWYILNRLHSDAEQRPGPLPLVLGGSVLNTLVLDLAVFSGMEMENMTRGHGWVFLDLGRRIERGIAVARLVEAALRCAGTRELLLESLLEIADSVITYRRRYFAEPHITGVLDLLLLDPTNPRALMFQLSVLQRHAANLPAGPNPEGAAQFQQRLAALAGSLGCFRAEDFDTEPGAKTTAERLAGLAADLGGLSELLTHVYFSHIVPQVS